MQDVLGREVNENDLVLGMTIDRHSDGMRFGVYNGISVNWRNGVTSVPANVYLIENPSEKEQGIKQNIIEKVKAAKERDEEAKAKRKALKQIPTKDLVVGKSYEDDRGRRYVYLGKGIVYDGYTRRTEQGYLYLSGYSCEYNVETDCLNRLPTVYTLKNPRKLVTVSEKTDISYTFDKQEFTLKEERRKSWFGGYDKEKFLRFKLGGNQ
jgi:hypothetical protein